MNRASTMFGGLLGGLPLAVFVVAYWVGGPVNAILYTLLFLAGATLLPVAIYLGAPSFPGSVRAALGKGQWILASVAYDVPFLVQRESSWELCPGRTRTAPEGREGYEVYIDDEWQPVSEGITNMTVLGLRPFGILRYKTDRTLVDVRADTVAERQRQSLVSGDGGRTTVERGGYTQIADPGVTGDSGQWLVDLKRVYSSGVQKIGDIAVIEKTEEVMTRKDAQESAFGGWEPIIATTLGLLLGAGMAWMMMAGG